MTTRIEVINHLIQSRGYKKYLEIGYGSGEAFKAISCEYKVCVDPNIHNNEVIRMTSNEFFEKNIEVFDCIFVDGLHHAKQVRLDIINASKCLSDQGAIVIHDINPKSKEAQEIPCNTPIWNGDVWRAWVGFKQFNDNKMEHHAHAFDHGVGIIFPEGKTIAFELSETSYEEFDEHRNKWL